MINEKGLFSNKQEDDSYKMKIREKTEEPTVITVVGPGCSNCDTLTENAAQAARELGLDYELNTISNVADILATGIMQTPGLIINDKIVSIGKVSSVEEIKTFFASME